jgi:hypothetical protein
MTDQNTHTYPATAVQTQDIADILAKLNEADKLSNERATDRDWGDGFRAMLPPVIPLLTDARGVSEQLGWAVYSESGWSFTQKPPAELADRSNA